MAPKDSTSSSSLPYEAEEAKKKAIRSLWHTFFMGWLSFFPTSIATTWHLYHTQGQESVIIIGLATLLSFLIMTAIQWNFIRGIKRNKKHSILRLALFIILFMFLGVGRDPSEDFSLFMGRAYWLIYISGFGLFFCSLWQLHILWVLQKKLAPYGL